MVCRSIIPLAVALALSAPGSPGSVPQPREKPPSFPAEVLLVSVPVFVTDEEGRAMRGLQPADFELYYDGKRVQPVSFQYVDTTSPEDQEAIRESPAGRRRFLFLFDMSFTDPGGLQRAQAAARRFLRSLPDRIDLPGHWLAEGVTAEVRTDRGRAAGAVLGPEPIIGAQRIVLRLESRQLAVATDGLGPFVVDAADASVVPR